MRVSTVSPLPDKLLKKQNKQTKQRQIHRYREQTDGCHRGGVIRGLVKKVKELRTTNWSLQNGHEEVKCSIGSIVNNIVIATYGVRRVLDLSGM